jgi:hypothetical protein
MYELQCGVNSHDCQANCLFLSAGTLLDYVLSITSEIINDDDLALVR